MPGRGAADNGGHGGVCGHRGAGRGRGRVIPKYPLESMMVPIAEWLGVEKLDAVFPNLANFSVDTDSYFTFPK